MAEAVGDPESPRVRVEVREATHPADAAELVRRASGLRGRLPVVMGVELPDAWVRVHLRGPSERGVVGAFEVELPVGWQGTDSPAGTLVEAWRRAERSGRPGARLQVVSAARGALEQAVEQVLVWLPGWLVEAEDTLVKALFHAPFVELVAVLEGAEAAWTTMVLEAGLATMAEYLEGRFPVTGPVGARRLVPWEREALDGLGEALEAAGLEGVAARPHGERHRLGELLRRLQREGRAPRELAAVLVPRVEEAHWLGVAVGQQSRDEGEVVSILGVQSRQLPVWIPHRQDAGAWGVCRRPLVAVWVRAVLSEAFVVGGS